MVVRENRPVSWGIAVLTGLVILLCAVSGIATASGEWNYVNNSNITSGSSTTYLDFGEDFGATFTSNNTDSWNETTGELVYVIGKTGLTLDYEGNPAVSGMTLTFTVPKEAVNRTGTRGAFVFPKSSGYGTENGIRIAPVGVGGTSDGVALAYEEVERTVSVTLTVPPKTAFTPKLMYENPVGGDGVNFHSVSGMASGEASNVVSNTTIYGAEGNATGYYDSSLVTSGVYLMDVITAHVENNTAAPVYLSVANSSLENLTDEGKNKITLYDVRGAAVRNASAFQLNGTMSGINVTGFDGSEVMVPLENVTRDNVSMVFNVSTDDVEHPRVVELMADTLATEKVVVDSTVVPAVWNVTVNPNEDVAEEGTEDVTLKANMGAILPKGYTEVEYIESTGTQWIDTLHTSTINTGIRLKYELTDYFANPGVISTQMGVDKSAGCSIFGLLVGTDSENRYFLYGNNGWASSQIIAEIGTPYELSYNYKNNNQVHIGESSFSLKSTRNIQPLSIYLFQNDYEGSPHMSTYTYAKVYFCEITEGTEIVRDFVPCISPSNEVGMYDLVTDTFFGNEGTGEFVAGPVVDEPSVHDIKKDYGTVTFDWYARNATTGNEWTPVGTTTTNSTTVTVSKDISTEFCVNASNVAGFDNTSETPVWFSAVHVPVVEEITVTPATVQAESGGGVQEVTVTAEPWLALPEGYTEVEYIENAEEAYIDTGYTPTIGDKISLLLDAQVTKIGSNKWFTSWYGSSASSLLIGTYSGNFHFTYGLDSRTAVLSADTNRHVFKLNTPTGTYVDDTLVSSDIADLALDSSSVYSIPLFTRYGGTTPSNITGKVYSFKILSNGEYVRYLVPCIRNSDSEIGMYDAVSGKFFTNAGTGEFIAGPVVAKDYGTVHYEWFARNTTTGNTWKSIGNTTKNMLSYTVKTTENTQFSVNASNIAGNNESTKDNPGLFAIYTTLTLDAVGGDNTSQVVNATLGSSVLDKTVNASTKEDCTFRGWDVIASPKNITVINETGVLVSGVNNYTDANGNWTNKTGEITLYANWSSVYNIRYHANNGTTVNVTMTDIPYNKSVKLNSTAELRFTPQDGLTFVNWTTYANGTGSSYADEAEVKNLVGLDETADLYAVWQTNQTALNSSEEGVTIGGKAYTKWNASAKSPYVVGYDTFNGTAVFGPFVIESPGAAHLLNYTLTKENLTDSQTSGRINVTYFDDGESKDLAYNSGTNYTFEDHDGNGYINLTESGRLTTGLSNVSVVVKEYPLGDANTNDLVDIVDSASVGVYILKGGEPVPEAADIFLPDENKVHGDVNHDGVVDVADMLKINQYLVGTENLG